MTNRRGKSGSSNRFYFLVLQNYYRLWLQSWNKKTLAPRKGSYDKPKKPVKKQRNHLLTNDCIIKAVVSPIVMYSCEKWTIKKAEHQRIDAFDLLAVQGTLESLLKHHSSKASILRCSAFFIVQLSHPYMTTGKTRALIRWTFIGKAMSLLLNILSSFVITFLPRSKYLLISWLQSPSAVILEPPK